MPHPGPFGMKICPIEWIGACLEPLLAHDFQTSFLQTRYLARIIGQQGQRRDPEQLENSSPRYPVTRVSRETELEIGFQRILAGILQSIRPDLVTKTDAPAS